MMALDIIRQYNILYYIIPVELPSVLEDITPLKSDPDRVEPTNLQDAGSKKINKYHKTV